MGSKNRSLGQTPFRVHQFYINSLYLNFESVILITAEIFFVCLGGREKSEFRRRPVVQHGTRIEIKRISSRAPLRYLTFLSLLVEVSQQGRNVVNLSKLW